MGEMIMFAATMLWANKQELLSTKESIENQLKEFEKYDCNSLTISAREVLIGKYSTLLEQLEIVNEEIKKIDDKFQIVIKYILHAFRFMI